MNSIIGINGRARYLAGLFFLCVSSVLGGLEEQVEQLPEVLAVVNEEPLLRDAVLHWMKKDRHATARYFHRQYGIDPGPGFWDPATLHGGENPLGRLLHQSMEEAINALLLQQLASANGIIDPDPVHMDQRRRDHNQRRGQTLSAGGLIYGPRHFAAPAFQDHYLALLKLELEALLLQGDLVHPGWVGSALQGKVPPSIYELVRDLRNQAKVTYNLPVKS
ncbi:MAG TPA: hypothetical protein VJ960_06860 [Oceanipulchritudo sp.]|nr:hypothetical protein [Oceanipulchritudo sp.]